MSTVKVLSIDGGGERGIIPVKFLQLFCGPTAWDKPETDIWKYFDVISGSSIGAIIACAIAYGITPTDLMPFFDEDGPWIFSISSIIQTKCPDIVKASCIGTTVPETFYPSDTDDIGTVRLKAKLTEVFGTAKLSDLKTKVIITSFWKDDAQPDFESNGNTPVYFSNISPTIVPGLIGQDMLVVDACMASAAAPLYFAPYSFTLPGEDTPKKYIDGGVVQNNPASFALTAGKAINPGANRFCVLSAATGLGDVGFPPETFFSEALDITANIKLVMALIGITTTAPQEIVAKELSMSADLTLDNLFYYRFQYYLDDELDTSLDNTTEEIRDYYRSSAEDYFNDPVNNAKIMNFIGHLDA